MYLLWTESILEKNDFLDYSRNTMSYLAAHTIAEKQWYSLIVLNAGLAEIQQMISKFTISYPEICPYDTTAKSIWSKMNPWCSINDMHNSYGEEFVPFINKLFNEAINDPEIIKAVMNSGAKPAKKVVSKKHKNSKIPR